MRSPPRSRSPPRERIRLRPSRPPPSTDRRPPARSRRRPPGREAEDVPAAEEAEEAPAADQAQEAPAAEDVPAAAAPAPDTAPKKKKKRLPRAERRRRPAARRERSAKRKPIVREPKPERERGTRKERRGVVVSAAMDKTIVVRVDSVKPHPVYKKIVRRSQQVPRPRRGQRGEGGRPRAHHRDSAAFQDEELAPGGSTGGSEVSALLVW